MSGTVTRCPHCDRVLPAPNLERCLWCRAELVADGVAAAPPDPGALALERPAADPGSFALARPAPAAVPRARPERAAPPAVRAVAGWLHFLAFASWAATAVAACLALAPLNPVLLTGVDVLLGGLALGVAAGFFLRRIARALTIGEPSARLQATVLFALHLLRWPLVPIGVLGLAALHAGAGARWLAARRRVLLAADDEDRVRPYWRRNGIDGM